MSAYETLMTEQQGAVLTIRLHRPKANAMNLQMLGEIKHALRDAAADESLRCLVLTGSGKMFSAGQDISVLAEGIGTIPLRHHIENFYNQIVMQMRELEKPILGAINGPVAGAALGIALATDIRIATESARFVFGFTDIGLTADTGLSLTLPLMIGLGRAMEIAFTNQPLSAQQALEYGLVNRVVPDETFAEAWQQWADTLANGPTRSMAFSKRVLNHAVLANLQQVLTHEAYLQQVACRTQDHAEGVSAFMEKRPAKFSGK
ncbi:MAG: enoyl-CoA hydratase-related protein [Anaerolineales bacterium]|jgi:2-(1,2-epoxy-1,2-dihydrophenyl)acetyl-CoA isomerase